MLNYYKKPSAQPRNSLGTPKANWMAKTASGPEQQAATDANQTAMYGGITPEQAAERHRKFPTGTSVPYSAFEVEEQKRLAGQPFMSQSQLAMQQQQATAVPPIAPAAHPPSLAGSKPQQGVGAPGDIQQSDVSILNRLYGKPASAPAAPAQATQADSRVPPPAPVAQPDSRVVGVIPARQPDQAAPPSPGSILDSIDAKKPMYPVFADPYAAPKINLDVSGKVPGLATPQAPAYNGPVREGMPAGTPVGNGVPDGDVIRGSQQRYLADQGPTGRQLADGMNTQADRMQAEREGAMARAENPSTVPYGARSTVGPLGGEGELRRQQAMKQPEWMMTEEQALAGGRADVDAMKATRAANSAEMSGRTENSISNPNQMRKDLQTTTDAYSIYKRKGGDMDFRKWANIHNEQTNISPDVKNQLANNYPGIWGSTGADGQMQNPKVDVESTDYNSVAANYRNPTTDKLDRRRNALLALQNSESAKIANAVAHGGNPNQAWATMQNQGRQDDMMNTQMLYANQIQDNEMKGKLAIANAGKPNFQDEQLKTGQDWYNSNVLPLRANAKTEEQFKAQAGALVNNYAGALPPDIRALYNAPGSNAARSVMEQTPEGASPADAFRKAQEVMGQGGTPASAADVAKQLAASGIDITDPVAAEKLLIEQFEARSAAGVAASDSGGWFDGSTPSSSYDKGAGNHDAQNKGFMDALRGSIGEKRAKELEEKYGKKPLDQRRNVPWWAVTNPQLFKNPVDVS